MSASDRAQVIAEIEAAAEGESCPDWDYPRLVHVIEQALIDNDPFEMPAAPYSLEGPARRAERAALLKKLTKFRTDARRMQAQLEGYGELPPRTLLTWVNAFSEIFLLAAPTARLREQRAMAEQTLADIMRVAAWPSFAPKREPGRKEVGGPKQQLVRAVCYFISTSGEKIQFGWKSGSATTPGKRGGAQTALQDEQLQPDNATTFLIVAASKAFQLEAQNRQLRTELQKCRADLGRSHKPFWMEKLEKQVGEQQRVPSAES